MPNSSKWVQPHSQNDWSIPFVQNPEGKNSCSGKDLFERPKNEDVPQQRRHTLHHIQDPLHWLQVRSPCACTEWQATSQRKMLDNLRLMLLDVTHFSCHLPTLSQIFDWTLLWVSAYLAQPTWPWPASPARSNKCSDALALDAWHSEVALHWCSFSTLCEL